MTLEEILELHRAGELDRAQGAYREYLVAAPDDADALHLLGVLYRQRGDLAAATDAIRQAIQLAPEHAQFHLSFGGILMELGEEEGARGAFLRALELDPNSVEAHTLVGHLHMRDGDVSEAENRFKIGRRAADQFEDDDPMILLGLGNVFLARSDWANATKFLSRAAERKPQDGAIQSSLGRALFEQGAYAIAEKALENAVRLQPGLNIAKLYLARSRLRQDKNDAAREIFAELLAGQQQPFGANAGLGDVARKKGQIARAFRHYRRANEIDPQHSGAIRACAWCMEQMGDLPGAAKYLADGIAQAPDADVMRSELVGVFERMGQDAAAAEVRNAMQSQA